MTLTEKTKQYAIHCHNKTNHLYDNKPYEVHLQMVFDIAKSYSHLVDEKLRDAFLAAAWAHDVIEDCRQSYNDVKNATSKEVADLVFALTNEKGRNRAERNNEKYYSEMKNIPFAVLLKICDRIANLKYSIESKSKMAAMYIKENDDFIQKVDDGKCDLAIFDLKNLCSNNH